MERTVGDASSNKQNGGPGSNQDGVRAAKQPLRTAGEVPKAPTGCRLQNIGCSCCAKASPFSPVL